MLEDHVYFSFYEREMCGNASPLSRMGREFLTETYFYFFLFQYPYYSI